MSYRDGFRLAELDVEQRWEGDVLGAAHPSLAATVAALVDEERAEYLVKT